MNASAASALDRLRPPRGLRVLVTAGASGIGRAIAEAFLDAGARVAVCDISRSALAEMSDAHPDTPAMTCDVGEASEVERMVARAVEAFGGLDVVVNNAGIAGPTDTVDRISVEDWDRTIRVNLDGQFYTAHAAAPALRDSQGLMVNISSAAGRLPFPRRTPYAASKWGVVGLTKSLASEMGPDGVRVNAILPGVVSGPRMEQVYAARAEAFGLSLEETRRQSLENVSLRRMVEVEDIASCCLFLASPGGRNISGQAISVCGNLEKLS